MSALVGTKLCPFLKFRLGVPRNPLCLHQPLKGQNYDLFSNFVSGFSGVLIACISLCKDKTMPFFQSLCWDSQESSLLVSALVRTKLCLFFKFRLGVPKSPLCLHQPLNGQNYARFSNFVSGFSGAESASARTKLCPFFKFRFGVLRS